MSMDRSSDQRRVVSWPRPGLLSPEPRTVAQTAKLFKGLWPFRPIAGITRCNEIVKRRQATLAHRDQMVDGQRAQCQHRAAVPTMPPTSQEDAHPYVNPHLLESLHRQAALFPGSCPAHSDPLAPTV